MRNLALWMAALACTGCAPKADELTWGERHAVAALIPSDQTDAAERILGGVEIPPGSQSPYWTEISVPESKVEATRILLEAAERRGEITLWHGSVVTVKETQERGRKTMTPPPQDSPIRF